MLSVHTVSSYFSTRMAHFIIISLSALRWFRLPAFDRFELFLIFSVCVTSPTQSFLLCWIIQIIFQLFLWVSINTAVHNIQIQCVYIPISISDWCSRHCVRLPVWLFVCVMTHCRDFLCHLKDCQHVNMDSATQSLLFRVTFNCHVNKIEY